MAPAEAAWPKFVLGGLSCQAAAMCTNPIDVIKVRLQVQGEGKASGGAEANRYKGFLRGIVRIVTDEGIFGLWKGITPSLLREGSYSTIRLGLYDVLRNPIAAAAGTDLSKGQPMPLWAKIAAGATAGSIGSAIANPTDLVKVRMQAASEGARYRGTVDAFQSIFRSEGLKGLYRGTIPTTARATIVTAAQLPSYDHSKHLLVKSGIFKGEGLLLHFTCSVFAGFVTAAASSPADVVKTRWMNQKVAYSGIFDCVARTVQIEGFFGLYKGFIPNWMRIGPHTVITFIVYENLRKLAGLSAV